MADKVTADQIGLMILDALGDHFITCEEDEMPVFVHAHDPDHSVKGGVIESAEVDIPEGDYTNLLLTLSGGEMFRVQILPR